jgi:hypothetical protein
VIPARGNARGVRSSRTASNLFFFAFFLYSWAWGLVMDGKRDGEVSIGEMLIFGLVLGG